VVVYGNAGKSELREAVDKPGEWQVAFFRLGSGAFRQVDSRMITRIGPLGARPAAGGLAAVRPQHVSAPQVNPPVRRVPVHHSPAQTVAPKTKKRNDQFNLLPASNLDDLGI